MKRLSRITLLILIILFSLSCTHPKTGKKTDPWTAFWYSLDAPSSSLKVMSEYRQGSYYHLNHHYDKVIVQQADPRFASDLEVDD
jgi:hypothetical protein